MKHDFFNLRIFSFLFDCFVVLCVYFFLTIIIDWDTHLGSYVFLGRKFDFSFNYYFAVWLVYFWLADVFSKGITFGKGLFKIKTVAENGRELSLFNRIIRSFLKTLSIGLLLPVLYFLVTRKTFHDRIANSKTIKM